MKITSKARLYYEVGGEHAIDLEVEVTDKRLESESRQQAVERVNYLARQGLIKQMDTMLAQLNDDQRNEAYHLVGIPEYDRGGEEWRIRPDGSGYWYSNEGEPSSEVNPQWINEDEPPAEASGSTTEERQAFLDDYAGTVSEWEEADSGVKTVELKFQNYVHDPEAAYISSYQWELDGGTLVSGSLNGQEIKASFPVGLHLVKLTTTDEGGDSKTYRIHVVIHSNDIPF